MESQMTEKLFFSIYAAIRPDKSRLMYVCFMTRGCDELNIAESVESLWWGCMLNSPLPWGRVGTPAKTLRENPQRIGFCYKIQLKIISWLDLIFHHIVIVHSNSLRRNLT